MTGRTDGSVGPEIPADWDVLADDGDGAPESADGGGSSASPPDASVPVLNLVAGSWADAVSVLAVCTAALAALSVTGHREALSALPWAVVMATCWWIFAAGVLVAVRQGTPGMLLAGVALADRIAPRRLAVVVAAAAVQAVLLGAPAALGPRRSPVAVAAGSRIESLPTG